jgi:alpha/beta superfamily hydrolase
MTRKPERLAVPGPAGSIEVAVDQPAAAPAKGIALVAHPHPLFGGALDNKVAATLARTFAELGYISLRPNFRGVGASQGEHDHGVGETDDLVSVIEWGRERFGATAVALAGFSFGAYVQTRVAKRVQPLRMALVGVANGQVEGTRSYSAEPVPADTIVIHGELDETVPLKNVLDWARPQDLPVIVVPGADHFFHRRLHILRNIIKGQWRK